MTDAGSPALREAARVALAAEAREQRLRQARRTTTERRQQAVEAALDELRACATTRELVDRAPRSLRSACGARHVALSRVRDGVRTPWLGDLADDAEVVVVAPVRVDAAVVGLLEAQFDEGDVDDGTIEVVARLAGAVGRAFAGLAERARLRAQERTVARLREALAPPGTTTDGAADELPTAEPGDRGVPGATSATAAGADPFATLTPRQRQTLDLMALGLSNGEIADRLLVGVPTVKSHVGAVLRAAGALNRAEAVKRYVETRPTSD
ncbi:helix-turn-helix transcriptional regulator [Patulibacter minatonensis]|uniref:helix-turn-helix transcriptional regulator n=1 Tax=Patulibacter minatonensis TaxID=298163 RepID=UPI00047B767D|nr:helix-turn-helix transcriptional regulator [Patulibacter minatonensis]